LSNRAPYRTNPEETKEIQRQVQELLDKDHVSFLGYVVTPQEIEVDQAKVEAIHSWPVPQWSTKCEAL
jgi:hypothetical protein